MIDDDHLDPALVDRFRALADIGVPETWSQAGRVTIRHEATASSRRWLVTTAAVAAVALLVIAGIALASRSDDGVVVGPVVTDVPSTVAPVTAEPSSPTTPAATASPTTVVVAPSLATADPQTGRPGDLIVLTPNGVIDRECLDIVTVWTADGETAVGQLFTDGSWFPIPEGASPTYPACYQPPSDAPLTLTLPQLDAGVYRFCLDWAGGRDTCALVGVEGDGPASVEPSGPVTPGWTITITPAGAVERICTDIVQIVRDGVVIGQIWDVATGAWEGPSDDGTFDVPGCAAAPSADPLDVVVPVIPTGTYELCLSSELLTESCAQVAVN